MLTRKKLIRSREYWMVMVHMALWEIHGSIEKDSDKWERLANKIIDKKFMKGIKELYKKSK